MVSIASRTCSSPNCSSPRSVGRRFCYARVRTAKPTWNSSRGPTIVTRVLTNVNGPIRTYKTEKGEADDLSSLPYLPRVAPSPSLLSSPPAGRAGLVCHQLVRPSPSLACADRSAIDFQFQSTLMRVPSSACAYVPPLPLTPIDALDRSKARFTRESRCYSSGNMLF